MQDKLKRIEKILDCALKMLESCSICPRRCGINRLKDEKGFCRTGLNPVVYSFVAHHGEEPLSPGRMAQGQYSFLTAT